jgi:ribose transport system permease protein
LTVAEVAARQASEQTPWRRLAQLQARFPILQAVALVVAFAIGAATLPGLATWQSGKIILVLASLAGLAAVGQTLLILMGGFDLSIAGIVVASALIVTQVKEAWGVSFGTALLVALAGAGALGALAGQICHRLNIQPLIVTLATGSIAAGLAQTQTPVGLTFGANAPDWLVRVSSPGGKTFGIDIPPLPVIWAGAAVVMTIFLHRTVAGRRLLATGANQRAANYALINTRRVWTLTFVFSAIASVFLGLFVAGFGGAITTSSGNPYLFQSVVVVILGGTIFGGPGDYLRTVVGALFVTVVNVVLVGHGATEAEQQMIFGAAVLLVVALYGRQRRIRDRV